MYTLVSFGSIDRLAGWMHGWLSQFPVLSHVTMCRSGEKESYTSRTHLKGMDGSVCIVVCIYYKQITRKKNQKDGVKTSNMTHKLFGDSC